jgi:pimeloyl-ACP methyl ester carboxylesterase
MTPLAIVGAMTVLMIRNVSRRLALAVTGSARASMFVPARFISPGNFGDKLWFLFNVPRKQAMLTFEEKGHGEPLVLLHGLGGSALSWDLVVPELQKHRRLILLNLPQTAFPGSILRWFDACGHFPIWDQPSLTVQFILECLDQERNRDEQRASMQQGI